MAIEVEFRDGPHAVPNHVAMLLRRVDTHTMTLEEAIHASEQQMLRDHLNNVQRKMISKHFREQR